MWKRTRIGKSGKKRPWCALVDKWPIRFAKTHCPARNARRARRSAGMSPAKYRPSLGGCRDHRAASASDVEISLHRQLLDDQRNGIARYVEVARQIPARRQTKTRWQGASQDAGTQPLIEMPRQGFSAFRRQL